MNMPESNEPEQATSLIQFKRLEDESLEDVHIPELPANRRSTDIKWLYALLAIIVALLPFMIYTLVHSDIKRHFPGYDQCGNVCGKSNYKTENIACSGANMTNYPFLQYETNYVGPDLGFGSDRRCVQSCASGEDALFGRCSKVKSANELKADSRDYYSDVLYTVDLWTYFSSVKWQLVISFLLSILLAIGVLLLFRYATKYIVWSILIGSFLLLSIFDIYYWAFYYNRDVNKGMLILAIFASVMMLFLGIILIWCRKKVGLVVKILKECTTAVFDMPGLTSVPVVNILGLLAILALYTVITAYMVSAGILEKLSDGHYVYVKNGVMIFAIVLNMLVFYWLAQMCVLLQYFIIAGAVSQWYFIRDKTSLYRPILTSVIVTFKYHLGSLALGSLIILIIDIIRAIIMSILKRTHLYICFGALISSLQQILLYLSRNALVVVAIHGQPFYKSGKRAAKLIVANLPNIVAVNYIGDFILVIAMFLIMAISTLMAVGVLAVAPNSLGASDVPSYICVFVVAGVVGAITFAAFKPTIETLLICYCEDNVLNNGVTKPYFMSRNLKEYIDQTKLLNEQRKCC